MSTIRPLALALIRHDDAILVEEGRDEVKGETFFRLLGGGIEFGERGADAVRRELREEVGVEAEVGPYLGVLENIFTYEGAPGHEIALVYECRLPGASADARREWDAVESGSGGTTTHRLAWMPLSAFRAGAKLYPDGATDLIAGLPPPDPR